MPATALWIVTVCSAPVASTGTNTNAAATLLAGVNHAAAAGVDPDQPQQTQNAGGQAGVDDTSLDQVVVQVNKRNQAIQDVAVAVTAYTSDQRDQLGVISIFDMTRAVPSFEYSTTLDRSFIRGVGRNTNAPGTQAGVTIYVDGVYTSSTYGLDRAPILSGTFEADAGPQGTLFGRNAIGGVLQQNSAHATDHFEIRTDSRYNDHDRFDQAVSIGGPIGEHLKLLVAGNIRKQTKGYFHNLYNDLDQGGPTSERLYYSILDFNFGNMLNGFWKIQTSGYNRYLSGFSQYGSASTNANPLFNDYSTANTALNLNPYINCTSTVPSPTSFNPSGVRAAPSCPATAGQALTYYDPTNPAFTSPYLINQDYRTHANGRDTWETVFQNTFHLGFADLKYIGGYNQYTYDNTQDGDGNSRGSFVYDPDGPAASGGGASPAVTIYPIVAQYLENRHWSSHELNLSSTADGPLNWIVGAYYYDDSFHNLIDNYASEQTQLSASNLNNQGRHYYYLDYLAKTQAIGLFGQFDYRFTDKWTFTGGVRWNKDKEQAYEDSHYYLFSPGNGFGLTPYVPGFGYYASEVTSAFGIGATCSPTGLPTIQSRGANCTATSTAGSPTVAGVNTRQISDEWIGWGGVANLQYKPNEDTLLYLK
ncbi:MAG: TonB-dependent receptor, partial [Oxalobacteraceae bacterium]